MFIFNKYFNPGSMTAFSSFIFCQIPGNHAVSSCRKMMILSRKCPEL